MRFQILLIIGLLYLAQVSADNQFDVGSVGDEELKLKELGGDKEFKFSIIIRISEVTGEVSVPIADTGVGGVSRIDLEDTSKQSIISEIKEEIKERPLSKVLSYLFIFCLLLYMSKHVKRKRIKREKMKMLLLTQKKKEKEV